MQTKNRAQAIATAIVGLATSMLAVYGLELDPELAASISVVLATIIAAVIAWYVPEKNPAPSARETIRNGG